MSRAMQSSQQQGSGKTMTVEILNTMKYWTHNTLALTSVLANILVTISLGGKVVTAPCQTSLSRVTHQVVCNQLSLTLQHPARHPSPGLPTRWLRTRPKESEIKWRKLHHARPPSPGLPARWLQPGIWTNTGLALIIGPLNCQFPGHKPCHQSGHLSHDDTHHYLQQDHWEAVVLAAVWPYHDV